MFMEISTLIGTVFFLLYAITIVGLILLILLENRNPLKTIPWILVLIFLPGIGLVIYYFFGRDTRKLRIITRRIYKKFFFRVKASENKKEINEIPENYRPLAKLLNNSNYSNIYFGSDITVFTTGKEKLDSLLEEIEKATKHIHFQYFIFNSDKTGNIVKDALIKKSREGLKVRVLYDAMGCWHTKKSFFNEMKDNGIELYPFLKVALPIFTSKVNYRNHRKNVVIDGKVAFMGGMNIADRYIEGSILGPWRDTHFKIVGHGVHGLQSAFLSDWYSVSREFFEGKEYFPEAENYTDGKMQILMSGPTDPWRTLTQAFNFCISNAKRYIYIQTPYFLPTEGLNLALQMAALGGIDVRLMLTKKSDTETAQKATLSYVDKMLRAGVKVYMFNKGFLHSKILLTDDMLTCFGSSNFDFRSFEHNFELNAFVYQRDFALKMKEMFMHDLANDCEEIGYSEWKKRPLMERLSESFMRLFSPLL
jgi:cardiolipin synthase